MLVRFVTLRSRRWLRSDEMRVGSALRGEQGSKVNYKEPTEAEFTGRKLQYEPSEKQLAAPKKRKAHLQWSKYYKAKQARKNNLNIVTNAVVTNP